MRKILIMTSLLALALSCTKSPASKILVLYYSQTSNTKAVPAEIDRFLKEGGFIEGEYEKYDDFPAAQPATEEEAAIFDAAVAGYSMLNAKAENVSSRAVTGGTEYLFEARDIPREPDQAEQGHLIKVYVLCEEGKAPVFTQVLR